MQNDNALQPFVSCIMPTYNRRHFVPKAIEYYLRQGYANRELIIVDDGTDSIEDLVPKNDSIRYIRLSMKQTIGVKRNIACKESKGDIIVHWDDDDWMAPWRLMYQVENVLKERSDICGINKVLYFEPKSQQAWQYTYSNSAKPWVAGNTLCYTKSFWNRNPFPDVNVGEDCRFVWCNCSKHIMVLDDNTFFIALIHSGNVCPKRINSRWWSAYPTAKIHKLMCKDWNFYTTMQTKEETPKNRSIIPFRYINLPRVLITVASGIGDVLRITPLISVMAKLGCQVDVLLSPDYPEVTKLLEGSPDIKRLFYFPSLQYGQKKTYVEELSQQSYEIAIFTQWSLHLQKLVKFRKSYTFDRQEWLREGDISCVRKIAAAIGWQEDLPEPFANPSVRRFDLAPGTIAIHPGCKSDWPWKKWHGFEELANQLPNVIVIGNPEDLDNTNTYFKKQFTWSKHVHNFTGKLSLPDTAALLAECTALVSNDSGIMHLGVALGIPTFGIFGITSPQREAIPSKNMYPITKGLPCETACRKKPWGRRDCENHLECLKSLTAQEVLNRVSERIQEDHQQVFLQTKEFEVMDRLKVIYYGYVYDASGYGNAARGYIHALNAAGVSLSVVNLSSNEKQVIDPLVESLISKPIIRPDFHIFHGIPWGWERYLSNLSNTIAMTVWETDTMPLHWMRILNRLREVWLPSDFNISAFKQKLKVPLFKLPHALLQNGTNGQYKKPKQIREIPEDAFVFYSIFEWQDRKNPRGLIESYLIAMRGNEQTLLFIKTNPDAIQVAYRDLENLRRKTGSKAPIEICCEGWNDEGIEALHKRGDCYISLHRGEGWGLPVFVAASKGKPIIATNYSGPTEFLNPDYHFLVRYQLTEVCQGYVYYHSRMRWAEPDIHHASELIRWVNDNRERSIEKAKRFAQKIKDDYSLDVIGNMARDHLLGLLNGNNTSKNVNNISSTNNIPPSPIPADWYDQDYFDNGKKSNWSDGYKWSSFAGLFRETADLLCNTFLSAESFLDVGCAKGFLIQTLREKGKIVQGFDHSVWAVNHALPTSRPYIVCAGVDDVQYTRKFDMLLALETFSHLTESQTRSFLMRVKSWIEIGLFATIPTFESDMEICEFKKHDKDMSHILLKSQQWWHELFLSTGWKQDRLHRMLQDMCQEHKLTKNMKWSVYVYSVGA